jgi:thiosulfate/3-mercaptopyruvate sulfurtransferase
LVPANKSSKKLFLASALAILFATSATLVSALAIPGGEKQSADPWTSAQTLQASQFAHELGEKSGTLPTVVYVGFHTLFAGGHIPGVTFRGSASKEQGLAELKKWADSLPRTANLVIYCGCCPFEKCPNIRPAFTAVSGMGFKKVRVLILPTSFVNDWAEKDYTIQKGM